MTTLSGWASRSTVATAADRMGVSRVVLSIVRRSTSPWITVLTYHRVAHRDAPTTFDPGVVDVTPEQFDRQLAFLRRWFHPIGVDELRAFTRGRGRLPRNPVMVTFDDGYRDNHDVALPLLLRHGVRATFFVATDYVDNRRLYWWDKVALIVARSGRDRIELTYPTDLVLPLGGESARREAVRRLQRVIKDTRGLDVPRFLGDVERAAGAAIPADEERKIVSDTIMTWEQVAALRRAGMDVQSHTHTHRVLQTLDPSALDRELRTSKKTLEDVLGERVVAVSYPVGKPLGEAPHIRRAVRDAGYDLGFSNATGVNRARALDPLDVKRLSLDLSIQEPFFRAMLALPWFAY